MECDTTFIKAICSGSVSQHLGPENATGSKRKSKISATSPEKTCRHRNVWGVLGNQFGATIRLMDPGSAVPRLAEQADQIWIAVRHDTSFGCKTKPGGDHGLSCLSEKENDLPLDKTSADMNKVRGLGRSRRDS